MTLRILAGTSDPETRSVPSHERALAAAAFEPPRFSELPQFKSRRSASFVCSVLCHAAVISSALFLSGPGGEQPAKPLLRNYSVRYLQLQAPLPPPRLPAGGSSAGALQAPAMPESKPAPEPPKAAMAGGAPEPKTARAEPRKFELPRLPQAKRVEQTLIQLELPPEMAARQDVRVPTVVIWDAKTQNLPRPPARKFIAPTRKEIVKAPPSLLAEPKLEAPNQERNIADLNFSAVRATEVPLLPKPPSSTTPIRIASSAPTGPIPQSAASDSGAHEPANVISIPDMPLPPAKVLIIPAINQVAAAHMAGGGDQGFGSEAAGSNVGGGQAEQGGGGKGAGQGSASGTGSGTSLTGSLPGGGGAGVSGTGGRGAGAGAATGGGAGGTGSGTGAAGAGAGNGATAGAAAGNGRGSGAGDGTGTGSAHVARIVRPQ